MKVHYWDGSHGGDMTYPVACGKLAYGWRFKYWHQRKWKGVTCGGCLRSRRSKRSRR